MTPLYGFGSKAGQPMDYQCDCTLCGGDQTDWEALSHTQKMVRVLILIAQHNVDDALMKQPFKN